MDRTIRQAAQELGVSKTTIRTQIENLGLRSGLRKTGNRFAISEDAFAQIERSLSKKSQTESQTEKREVCDFDALKTAVDALEKQLEAKDSQIAAKDAQIAALTSQLSETTAALRAAQDTAKAAQALHAADVQRLEAPSDNQAAPDAWKAKGLFARVFKR